MSTTTEATTSDPEGAARLASLCLELGDLLGRAKKSIEDEIRTYPTPIPRCDAQFNYLYEQRSRLAHILAQANAMSTCGDVPSELVDALAEFTASAPFTEDAREQALRERISAELSRSNQALYGLPRKRK